MLRQKIKISPNGTDANVNILFKSKYNLGGLSEDVEKLVTDKTSENINDTVDGENLRFTPLTTYSLAVYFYNTGTTTYQTNVAPNEFASSAITSTAFLNSFYVYKIFDSQFENDQNLLYTGYLNGYDFNGYSSGAYSWNNDVEYADIHIPNSFISELTGNTFNLYMKINFYSAKSGKVYPFSGVTTTNTESDLYNKLTFTATTKQYKVSTFTFKEIKNITYANLVNDSVDSLSIEKQAYPSGNTFTTGGIYETIG